jgi:hypothetical protein
VLKGLDVVEVPTRVSVACSGNCQDCAGCRSSFTMGLDGWYILLRVGRDVKSCRQVLLAVLWAGNGNMLLSTPFHVSHGVV